MSKDTGKDDHGTQFLIDFPESYGSVSFDSRGSLPYSDTVRNLIVNAERSIRIAIPFVDDYGARFLMNCLSANRHRPFVELVVREIPQSWTRSLCDVNVGVFVLNEDRDRWGFHAKYFVFDDVQAIIGSENLTERNIKRNLEIGVVVGPRISTQLVGIHKTLLTLSRRIL